MAIDFDETYGTETVTMVYDPTLISWIELGVSGQPWWILYDGAGNQVESRPGAIDEEFVLSVLAG